MLIEVRERETRFKKEKRKTCGEYQQNDDSLNEDKIGKMAHIIATIFIKGTRSSLFKRWQNVVMSISGLLQIVIASAANPEKVEVKAFRWC